MGNYGKRTCLHCGKTFIAERLFQLSCTEQCRRARRAEQNRLSKRRCAARIKTEREGLKARIRELESEVERLSANLKATSEDLAETHKELMDAQAELASARAELEKARLRELEAQDESQCQPKGVAALAPSEPSPEPPHKIPENNALHPRQKGVSTAPEVDTSGWEYCERMNVRAPKLPCGERGECEGCRGSQSGGDTVLEPGDKLCVLCGKAFTPNKPWQKYCSSNCQVQAMKDKIMKKGKRR